MKHDRELTANVARMRKRVSTYLTDAEYAFIERNAHAIGRPITEAIRRCIDEAMAAEKLKKGKS